MAAGPRMVGPSVRAAGVEGGCRATCGPRGRCHTPFRDSVNEASIRVPRMFHSHI
jgi:hypothetical protein